MARNLLSNLRLCVVRCCRLVFRSKSDFLIEQYQGLAALLEKEANPWKRLPSSSVPPSAAPTQLYARPARQQ